MTRVVESVLNALDVLYASAAAAAAARNGRVPSTATLQTLGIPQEQYLAIQR